MNKDNELAKMKLLPSHLPKSKNVDPSYDKPIDKVKRKKKNKISRKTRQKNRGRK